jgi:hypothetical protein
MLAEGALARLQGSDGVCCRRKTRVVGPPSEELNCFGAMKLRILTTGAESLLCPRDQFSVVSDSRVRCRSNSSAAIAAMNKNIGFELIVYSAVLACLGYVAYHLAPTLARPTLIAGLAGGVLCLVWGLRTVGGSRGKALVILTLIPLSFVLLSQVVTAWLGGGEAAPGRRTAAVVVTVAFAASIGMLIRIAYAGAVFDGEQPGPPSGSRAKESPAWKAGAKAKPDGIRR